MRDVAEAKLAAARAWLDPAGASEVQVDGGGRAETAEVIGRGGTDVIVAGSALYRAADMAAEVERIRTLAAAARAAAAAGLTGRRMRALLQRVSRAEVRVDGAAGRVDRAGPPGAPGRRSRRRRGDRRRAGPPDLRAADLRGRRGPDEPLAAGHGRRGAGRQPVHAVCGHAARPSAGVHRRCSPGPRPRLWLRVAGMEVQGVRTAVGEFGARWPSSWSTTGRSRSGSTRRTGRAPRYGPRCPPRAGALRTLGGSPDGPFVARSRERAGLRGSGPPLVIPPLGEREDSIHRDVRQTSDADVRQASDGPRRQASGAPISRVPRTPGPDTEKRPRRSRPAPVQPGRG